MLEQSRRYLKTKVRLVPKGEEQVKKRLKQARGQTVGFYRVRVIRALQAKVLGLKLEV